MPTASGNPKQHSKSLVEAAANGQPWLPGIILGVSSGLTQPLNMLVTKVVVSGGAAPTISFDTEFGTHFQNAEYLVMLTNDQGDTRDLGYSSKTPLAITVDGTTTNGDIITVILIGKTVGQP